MIRVVATGTWVYDQDVMKAVRVVESDRDFWFDVGDADGDLAEGEQPHLNEYGLCYYVLYREEWKPGGPFWPDSVGFMSLEQARVAAEAKLPSVVEWAQS